MFLLVACTEHFRCAVSRAGAHRRQRLKVLESDATFPFVDLGNMLQYLDSFPVSTAVDEEFWRFLESEDDEADEEDGERYRSEREHQVSPAHVACSGTARSARSKICRATRRQRVILAEVG